MALGCVSGNISYCIFVDNEVHWLGRSMW